MITQAERDACVDPVEFEWALRNSTEPQLNELRVSKWRTRYDALRDIFHVCVPLETDRGHPLYTELKCSCGRAWHMARKN